MEKEFWLDRWSSNKIGFHQEEFNTYLTSYWKAFTDDKQDVLVPLCGKSKDMIYLANTGHKVLGVELSRIAVEAFFKENKIEFSITKIKNYEVFKSKNITIYCGDLLNLEKEDLKNIQYVYDRASLVALPENIREKYLNLIYTKLPTAKLFLQTVSFDNDKLGPPFSLDADWVNLKFQKNYNINHLESDRFEGDDVQVHSAKVSFTQNNIFGLKPF